MNTSYMNSMECEWKDVEDVSGRSRILRDVQVDIALVGGVYGHRG
jgi:hypothetical protein